MEKIRLVPFSKKCVIEPLEDKLKGGLVTSDKDKGHPDKGNVLAVGNEFPEDLKVGDIVFYQKFDVGELKINQKEYVVAGPEALYCKQK